MIWDNREKDLSHLVDRHVVDILLDVQHTEILRELNDMKFI